MGSFGVHLGEKRKLVFQELEKVPVGKRPHLAMISRKVKCSGQYVSSIWKMHPHNTLVKDPPLRRKFVDKNIHYRREYVKATLKYWAEKKGG